MYHFFKKKSSSFPSVSIYTPNPPDNGSVSACPPTGVDPPGTDLPHTTEKRLLGKEPGCPPKAPRPLLHRLVLWKCGLRSLAGHQRGWMCGGVYRACQEIKYGCSLNCNKVKCLTKSENKNERSGMLQTTGGKGM